MQTKKVWLTVFILFISTTVSFAGDVLVAEGIERYNEGVRAQKAGDYNSAKSAYQKAILLGSTRADINKAIYNNMGVIYAEIGDFSSAMAAFQSALTIDPDYKEANFNLGIVYGKMGDVDRALNFVMKAFKKTGGFIIQEEKPE